MTRQRGRQQEHSSEMERKRKGRRGEPQGMVNSSTKWHSWLPSTLCSKLCLYDIVREALHKHDDHLGALLRDLCSLSGPGISEGQEYIIEFCLPTGLPQLLLYHGTCCTVGALELLEAVKVDLLGRTVH
jgi:hypothetical protein